MLRFVLPLVLLTTACGISVNHSSTGPGTYLVTAEGQDRHSHAEVSRAANDRAMELCGPDGYQPQSQGSGTQVHGHANTNSAYVGSKGSVSLYIICNNAQEQPAAEPAAPEPAAPGTSPGGY